MCKMNSAPEFVTVLHFDAQGTLVPWHCVLEVGDRSEEECHWNAHGWHSFHHASSFHHVWLKLSLRWCPRTPQCKSADGHVECASFCFASAFHHHACSLHHVPFHSFHHADSLAFAHRWQRPLGALSCVHSCLHSFHSFHHASCLLSPCKLLIKLLRTDHAAC